MDISKRELWAGALLAATAAAPAARADTAQITPIAANAPEPPFAVWLAINRATQTYADCLDRLDLPGLAALFTPDCVFDYAPGVIMNGRDGIRNGALTRLGSLARTSHHVGPANVVPGEEAGTYRSTVYFMAYHQVTDGGEHMTVYGRYVDLFKADASGRWLIAHRQAIGHAAEGVASPRYWLPRHTT